MIPDHANNVAGWPVDKLVVILLRQFKRLLNQRDVPLTDAQMQQIGQQVAARDTLDDAVISPIKAAMVVIVNESVGVLAGWDLTFAQSLQTTMSDISGWETTADFLEIANEKINAEVRICAGSSLLVLLGDYQCGHFLLQAIDYDLEATGQLDVDAMIAKRALLHAAQINAEQVDWLQKARTWMRA